MNYVLDTNVLIAHGELLAYRAPGVQFVIPVSVLEELERIARTNRAVQAVRELVEAARRGTTLKVVSWRDYAPEGVDQVPGLDVDSEILGVTLAGRIRGEPATLVTDDKQLLRR